MKHFIAVADWGYSGAPSSLLKCLRQKFVCLQNLTLEKEAVSSPLATYEALGMNMSNLTCNESTVEPKISH